MIVGKIQNLIPSDFKWFSTLLILMLAMGSLLSNARAGINVVAWGAGKTVNTNSVNDYGQSIVPNNLTNAVQVAGGWQQSMVVKADGTLEGWGYDALGQTNFPAGSNYLCVACGDQHSLALESDGTVVVATEYNFHGEADIPSGLSNVVAVSSGFYHCLALKSDGTVAAWGGLSEDNGMDDGDGSVPSGLSNVVAIAAGGYHNLVLKSDGTVFAWGDNTYGQTNVPAGLSNVVAIAAGDDDNLVLKSDGSLYAWGNNTYGETDIPSGLSNIVAIASGSWHNLALKSDGTVVAWGLDTEGDTNVPSNLTNVIQIAAGNVHSLALLGNAPPVLKVPIAGATFGTNGFNVSLPTRNGRVYCLEYKDSLTDQIWNALPLRAGTGGVMMLTDPSVSMSQRFYRVRQW
jgi:alpha-tubulin suppressor-like RCC1 family protein